MIMPLPNLRISILLSLQRALTGEVFPALRDVSVRWQDKRIFLTCVVEQELADEDQESLSCIETEMYADFPHHEIETQVLVVPDSTPIPHDGVSVIVYRRREMNHMKF